jgi:polar amino acid transport system substrate-binding protein
MKSPFSRFRAAAIVYFLTLGISPAEALLDEELPPSLPTPSLPKETLVVGVNVDPPFNIHNPDGSWTGISVELWQEIAKDLSLKYEFREVNLVTRFRGLAEGWLDISIGPLTITAPREEVCDFTHAYYWTNLAIAVPSAEVSGGSNFPLIFTYLSFLWAVFKVGLGLLAVMAVVAVLIWCIERRANAAQFGGGDPVRGLGLALWWSAVTMASVGYGDVIPRTVLGRAIAVIWMFASLVLISTFTATMASTLTAESLGRQKSIQRIDDLRQLRIGAVENSTGAKFLELNHVTFERVAYNKMFSALESREIGAIVYDEPILRYAIQSRYPGNYAVLPLQLDRELYGFALKEGSSLREPLNRIILQKIHQPAWQKLVGRYLSP